MTRKAERDRRRAARALRAGRRDAARGPKPPPAVHSGANLRSALSAARALGCVIRPMPGTDDAMVTHPSYDGAVQVKVTRKDATRELTAMLNRVVRGRYPAREAAGGARAQGADGAEGGPT